MKWLAYDLCVSVIAWVPMLVIPQSWHGLWDDPLALIMLANPFYVCGYSYSLVKNMDDNQVMSIQDDDLLMT